MKKIKESSNYLVILTRKILWRILGVRWSTAGWVFRRNYLSTVDWVSTGAGTYDNGALVWRWSKKESLAIGKYCSIAYGVQFLCGSGHHQIDAVSTFPLLGRIFARDEIITIKGKSKPREDWDEQMASSNGPIIIENDVWIGHNATILSGVTIASGSIVLAGAIETKDVSPYTIVGGIPAQVIGQRFSVEQSQQLLKIAWWDWPEALIKERISDFYDIDLFISKYKQT